MIALLPTTARWAPVVKFRGLYIEHCVEIYIFTSDFIDDRLKRMSYDKQNVQSIYMAA